MKFVITLMLVAVFATTTNIRVWAAPRSLLSQFLGLEEDAATGSDSGQTSFPEPLAATNNSNNSSRSLADLIDLVDEKILGETHFKFTRRGDKVMRTSTSTTTTTTTTTPVPTLPTTTLPPTTLPPTTLPPTTLPTTTLPTTTFPTSTFPPTTTSTKLPPTTTTNSSTTVEPDPHPNDNFIVRFLRKVALFILEAIDSFLHSLHLGSFFGKLEEDAEYLVEKLIEALKKIFGLLYG